MALNAAKLWRASGPADASEVLGILAVAVAVDAIIGEPPPVLHPVVALGKLIAVAERHAPEAPFRSLVYGTAVAVTVTAAAGAVARACEQLTRPLPAGLRVLMLGAALKPAFAIGALLAAAARVERSLRRADLIAARRQLRALVGRDISDLDGGFVAAATIESLAENLTDSVVAPLLAYALAGLAGAYAYRAVNTLDSMIGYRGRYEWLGKAPARLDDAVNFVPARVAAGVLVVSAAMTRLSATGALRHLRQDAARTASPNAGLTMAAAAGAIGVRLEKREHYVLNPSGREPGAADIATARRLVAVASGGAVGVAALLTALRQRARPR